MAYQKNTAGQKFNVLAINTSTGLPITGDASNITAKISKDSGAFASVADTNPTELDATNAAGVYVFDLSQAETNGNVLTIVPVSTTANVQLDMLNIYTSAVKAQLDDIEDKVGDIDVATTAIESKTSQLTFTVANQVDANSLTGGTSPSAVADAVWDESLSAHQSAGSTGLGLTAAAATGGDATAANQTAILAKLNTNPIEITNPLVDSSTLVLINKDNYSANNSRLITFPVTINYASATSVKLIFQSGGTNIKVTGAVVASATSITVDLEVDFGGSLVFSDCSGAVCNQVATCDFALVATYGTDEETIARGTSYVYNRAAE